MSTNASPLISRRHLLCQAGAGFGAMAFAGTALQAGDVTHRPRPHHPPQAKAVIHLFMHGGPSQVDSFDPKPLLNQLDGKSAPEAYHDLKLQFTSTSQQVLMGSGMTFSKCGQSGIEICDALPNVQQVADDLCVIRGMHHEVINHSTGVWFLNTGIALPGRPSLGSWLAYGLGSESENLPAYVVMNDLPVKGAPACWGSGFLPSHYQGTQLLSGDVPIPHVKPPASLAGKSQRAILDYTQALNRRHAELHADDALNSRMRAYELAFRMQSAAPEAVNIGQETKATLDSYGDGFGRQCLIARRLVERGVRCVQIYHSGGSTKGGIRNDWDSHAKNFAGQRARLGEIDQGCAALIGDLKQRGLLDETLVVWTGEFGRTPTTEGQNGRDHNPYGYSMWMAGGGVKPGYVHGATDDLGFLAVEKPVHLHDLNATILHLMGIDHLRLTFHHNGRDYRLTDLHGKVVKDIMA